MADSEPVALGRWRLGQCPHGETERDRLCPKCCEMLVNFYAQEREHRRHRNAQRNVQSSD
jgi:hypothetical protein